MAAVAHNPAFAKKVGIPQSVGKDFNEADKMKKKFAIGGAASSLPVKAAMNSPRMMGNGMEPRQGPTAAFAGPMASQNISTAPRAAFKKGGNVKRKFDAGGDIAEDAKADAVKKLKTLQDANEADYRSKTDIFGLLGMPDRKAAGDRQRAQRDADFAMWRARKTNHMKKGGDVKMEKKVANYFAKKGEKALAAHENREAEGKEEDTKAIAKKEERVLKGGPKAMKDYESKEHKEMGFKGGGAMSRMMRPKMARRPAAVPPMGGPAAGGMPPQAMGMGMKKGGMAGKQLTSTKTENKGGQSKIGGGVEKKGSTKTKIVSSGRGMGVAQRGTRGAKEYAKGGGIESKGKTRGRMC